MNRAFSLAAGLLLGAAVGAGIVLLVAPRSGADTQQVIRDRFNAILAEGQQAAEMRRIELSERFQSLKQPAT